MMNKQTNWYKKLVVTALTVSIGLSAGMISALIKLTQPQLQQLQPRSRQPPVATASSALVETTWEHLTYLVQDPVKRTHSIARPSRNMYSIA